MTYSKRHPSAWLKENPNNVPAREKVASKRGKRVTAAASGSKRKKSIAQAEKSASKGIVIREPVTVTSQSGEQAAPRDASGKKTTRKISAKRKRSAALPSPILLESPSTNSRSKKHATTTYSEAREDEDSSTSLKDDTGASVEEVPIAADEITVFGAVAIETTAATELPDNVIAVAKTAGDVAAAAFDVFEEVNAAAVAAEAAVEEPEVAVIAGIVGDDGLT
ncbi:hypothetical protein FCV25MIE_18782 [Fagus crenata]